MQRAVEIIENSQRLDFTREDVLVAYRAVVMQGKSAPLHQRIEENARRTVRYTLCRLGMTRSSCASSKLHRSHHARPVLCLDTRRRLAWSVCASRSSQLILRTCTTVFFCDPGPCVGRRR